MNVLQILQKFFCRVIPGVNTYPGMVCAYPTEHNLGISTTAAHLYREDAVASAAGVVHRGASDGSAGHPLVDQPLHAQGGGHNHLLEKHVAVFVGECIGENIHSLSLSEKSRQGFVQRNKSTRASHVFAQKKTITELFGFRKIRTVFFQKKSRPKHHSFPRLQKSTPNGTMLVRRNRHEYHRSCHGFRSANSTPLRQYSVRSVAVVVVVVVVVNMKTVG